MTNTMAVLATIPGREAALERCLASLRPQVKELIVICHDARRPPACVPHFATNYMCEHDRHGSAAKLYFARSWQGLYLGCDDDLLYPADYEATMRRWVARWRGRALCCIGGRIFTGHASRYPDEGTLAGYPVGDNAGQWVNYPNAAGLAFDTRLNVPTMIPEKNQEEAYLTIWAQEHQVPCWLIPKRKGWIKWLLDPRNPGFTIWKDESGRAYPERNRLAAAIAARGWTMPAFPVPGFPPTDEPFANIAPIGT